VTGPAVPAAAGTAGARLLARRLAAALPAAAPSRAGAEVARDGVAAPPVPPSPPPPPLPAYVAHALARWRLLEELPFRYLVPDAGMLPPESIRFFSLDPAWSDALADGALAVGGDGSREQAQAGGVLRTAYRLADRHLPLVRDVARGRVTLRTAMAGLPAATDDTTATATATDDAPAPVTGFLLRSAAVTGWPGIQVRAWTSDDPADVPPGVDPAELEADHPELVVPLLRLAQLSPSVLLALFDGVPRLVWLEEPHHGVQLGLEADGPGWRVPVRDAQGRETGQTVAVPMRSGAVDGVVDVAGLAGALDDAAPLPAARGSAGVALALLQAPSRQRFAAGAAPGDPPAGEGRR
jgi:hypothetical protein